jgi:hypothetical protein
VKIRSKDKNPIFLNLNRRKTMASTLTIVLVSPDPTAAINAELILEGSSPFTITGNAEKLQRVARFIDSVAEGTASNTSVTVTLA